MIFASEIVKDVLTLKCKPCPDCTIKGGYIKVI